MRILIVEDERRLANIVKRGLIEDGFAVDLAYDGKDGKYFAEVNSGEYDLILLDVNLPEIDGLTLCRMFRKKGFKTPILMLSAMGELSDKVNGLDSGADDYLTKPFAFLELRSRIHALIRRSKHIKTPLLKIDNLLLDPLKHKVTRDGDEINLTPKEFSVLEFLLRNKENVITRSALIEHVWDYNFDSVSNIVDVIVANLRKKITPKGQKKLIYTIHGIGYKITADQAKKSK